MPSDLTLLGLTLSNLRLDWNNVHMHNVFSEEIIQPQSLINVPHIERIGLHSMLQNEFRINVLILHNNTMYAPVEHTCNCDTP